MSTSLFRIRYFLCLLCMMTGLAVSSPAASFMQRPTPPGSAESPNSLPDEQRSEMERDMAKRANEARHAALKRDTDKLLKLATELKDYVDKSNENILSVDVVKKSEEIEKLAHSVKEKMKGSN